MNMRKIYIVVPILFCLILAVNNGIAHAAALRQESEPLAVTTDKSKTTDTPTETQDDWINISPNIQWKTSTNGQTEENIAMIDLTSPDVHVELAYKLQGDNYETGIFQLKNIYELTNGSGAYAVDMNGTESYHPFVAINGVGFECSASDSTIPFRHGTIPNNYTAVLGIKEPLSSPQPGAPITGITHIFNSSSNISGRCSSFFTYEQGSEYAALIHSPSSRFPEYGDFPYIQPCIPPAQSIPPENADNASKYLFSKIVNENVDFAIGYEATVLQRPDSIDQVPEISIPDGYDSYFDRNNRTVLGIRYSQIDPENINNNKASRLYLGTVSSGHSLESFVQKLIDAGAHQAILLDGGESSQFLGFGQNGVVYNDVRESAFLGFGLLCREYKNGQPRKLINGLVVYDTSQTFSRENVFSRAYHSDKLSAIYPPLILQPEQKVAFVIDDTGSMGDEIAAAKLAVNRKLDEFVKANLPLTYHLLTYKDNVNYRGFSDNANVVKGWVNALTASGGNDCPEEMLGSLNRVIDVAPGSEVWLMTDAGFHGTVNDFADTAAKLARAKIKANIILYSWCFGSDVTASDQQTDQPQQNLESQSALQFGPEVFGQLANETGGHFFLIESAETEAATTILLNEMVANSDLKTSTATVSLTIPMTYSINTDSTTNELNFLLNVLTGSASMKVFNPIGAQVNYNDENVTYTRIGNAEYYQITSPLTGTWHAVISGAGTYAFSSSGNSAIQFVYQSSTSLAKDKPNTLLASLYGPIKSTIFELINPDGTLFATIPMLDDGLHEDGVENDGIFGGTYTPTTSGNYHLRVRGATDDNSDFERVATELIRVQDLAVVASPNQFVTPGTSILHNFRITNGGTEKGTFNLTVSSSQGWADTMMVPTSIEITAGATTLITVPLGVPVSATVGAIEETRLTVVNHSNALSNDTTSVLTTVGESGDCNGDSKISASDITALVIEFFDDDGFNPINAAFGTYPGTPGCDANRDNQIGASDISCISDIFFNGSGACTDITAASVSLTIPELTIPTSIPATTGQPVQVPIQFMDNSSNVSSLLFSVDYDENSLSFDSVDNNGDAIPDAITLNLPPNFNGTVAFDNNDTDGELDVAIYDFSAAPNSLTANTIMTVTFNATETISSLTVPVRFSETTPPSFGSTSGQDIIGSTRNGSVVITGYPLYLPLIVN